MADFSEFLVSGVDNPSKQVSKTKWNNLIAEIEDATASNINDTIADDDPDAVLYTRSAAKIAELVSSAVTAPVIITPPAVSGYPYVGQSLSVTPAVWDGSVSSSTYQWNLDGTEISGETGTTLTVLDDYVGSVITVTEIAHNVSFDSEPSTSAPTAAVEELQLVTMEAPTDQTILTTGVTSTVTASAHGASGATLYLDDVSQGAMTEGAGDDFTKDVTIASEDLDITLRVDATDGTDTSRAVVKIAVTDADGEQMWGAGTFSASGITLTSGQADPDGGTNSIKAIGSTGTMRRYLQFSPNPAATQAETSYRFRVELVGTLLPVLRFYNISAASASYGEIDLTTGQTLNNRFAITAVRQTGNVWDIWVRELDGSTGGTIWLELRGGFLSADSFNVPSGEHGIILTKMRVIDGPLGLYDRQKCSFRYEGETAGGLQRWIFRNAFEDSLEDQIQDYHLDVLVPDSWDGVTSLPAVVVHPAEPSPGPGSLLTHDLEAIKAGDLHNTFNCIFATVQTKRVPWGGVKSTGANDYQKLFGAILPGFLREFYFTLPGRENMMGMGYSKGGFGIFAVALNYWSTYGYIAAWDVPWTMAYSDMVTAGYGVEDNYGTEAQFDLYTPSDNIAAKKANWMSKSRMVIAGDAATGVFAADLPAFEAIVSGASIPHSYLSTVVSAHDADPDWQVPVFTELMALRAA